MRNVLLMGVVCLAGARADAGVLLGYEGDVLPELAGWTSVLSSPTTTQHIENGRLIFTIPEDDTTGISYRQSALIDNSAVQYEWAGKTSSAAVYSGMDLLLKGPSVWSSILVSWSNTSAAILIIRNTLEPDYQYLNVPLYGNEDHKYVIRISGDACDFLLDDQFVASAQLQPVSGLETQLQFGTHVVDGTSGIAEWDYIRVISVPEPTCWMLIGASVLIVLEKRRLIRRRGSKS